MFLLRIIALVINLYLISKTMRTKIINAKATFTGRSPRRKPVTTAGHPEGTEPKPAEEQVYL
jgi:hypothetical protein